MPIIILDYRIWNLFLFYISMPVMIIVSYFNDSFFYSFIHLTQQIPIECLTYEHPGLSTEDTETVTRRYGPGSYNTVW